MPKEEGVVTRVGAATAWVKTIRTEACHSCSSRDACHSLGGGGGEMEVEAANPAGAKAGDRVVLSLDTGPFLKATFLIYMVPILAMLLSAFVGQECAPALGWSGSAAAGIFGLAGAVAAVFFVRIKANRLAQKQEYKPCIIRVLR